VVGTLDKFAMLSWREKDGFLFGTATLGRVNPPSLVIQDEMHLITGPLGTIAAIYEAGIESVIRCNSQEGWVPKYIAATATIKNARTQSRRLFARETRIFPSPGISIRDSMFSRENPDPNLARLYVGVSGQGQTMTVALYWLMAAILQATKELEGNIPADHLDSLWTLLAYHNSKRELGRTRTAVNDEIQTRAKVYHSGNDDSQLRGELRTLELSAGSVDSISSAKEELGRPHMQGGRPAIDVVPCTSMISVGIDIPRLGLMVVNGQPKLTSEYIQATSRVGRRLPGLVATLYSQTKPRDRSHYEGFRDYHTNLYRHVEVGSVTPGALAAIERALHAALVIAVRHGAGLLENEEAGRFDPAEERTGKAIEILKKRLLEAHSAIGEEPFATRLEESLDDMIAEWKDLATRARGLRYKSNNAHEGLLRDFGAKDDAGLWETMTSMRSVDQGVEISL